MIKFNSQCQEPPYIIFMQNYYEALNAKQQNIEAISISSYNNKDKEVDSRFVNLKFVNGNEFIFFSNYNSPKSIAFKQHSQISALLYWSSVNIQIRMKANIQKTSVKYNQEYFKKRSQNKNALAISSNQSKVISSYDNVISNYEITKESSDLSICPEYWGGFSFIPYYFEFWYGHDYRLNKRDVYQKVEGKWDYFNLEP